MEKQGTDTKNLVDTEFLYQTSPCGYLSFYPNGTIIKINQILLTWLGLDEEAVTGKVNFSSIVSKAGRIYYEMVVRPLLQLQGYVNEINFDIQSKGETFPCLFNASTLKDESGEVVLINAIIFNITDRKKYEALLLSARKSADEEKNRFEFLCNAIPNIIWTALPTGEVDFVNERFFKTFGYKTKSLRFSSFIHLIHPLARKPTLLAWKASLQTQKNFEVEVRLKIAGETYEWFLITAVCYVDKNGNAINWFGSCTNINDQKEKERQRVQMLNDSLQEADKLISKNTQTLREIAFDQSHLIRHPLTNVMGIAKLIKETNTDNDLKQLVDMLQISAQQLDEVIKDIVNKTYLQK